MTKLSEQVLAGSAWKVKCHRIMKTYCLALYNVNYSMVKNLINVKLFYSFRMLIITSGHASTLPRQRDYLFRPQNCWVLHHIYMGIAPIHLDTENFIFFVFFRFYGRVAVVAKIKKGRLPSSANHTMSTSLSPINGQFSNNQQVFRSAALAYQLAGQNSAVVYSALSCNNINEKKTLCLYLH